MLIAFISHYLQISAFLSKSYKISAHLNYLLQLQQQVLYHSHDVMRHENVLLWNFSCPRHIDFIYSKDMKITVRIKHMKSFCKEVFAKQKI